MTQEEILKYNRRCAEFLGWKRHEKFNPPYFTSENGGWWEKELKFHSDWSWIMEVVEAIELLGYQVDIQNNHCLIQKSESFGGSRLYAETKKEAVVQAINQFLIWYYENSRDKSLSV